jgi:hypothetical protein
LVAKKGGQGRRDKATNGTHDAGQMQRREFLVFELILHTNDSQAASNAS